jgi:hypothetical protein
MSRRQAFRAWESHLEEAIGVTDAETVIEHLEERVTRADLDAGLAQLADQLADQLTDRLSSLWRRDLLLVITGQFVALAGVLTAIT